MEVCVSMLRGMCEHVTSLWVKARVDSFLWVAEIELRSPGLHSKHFYLLSQLIGTELIFLEVIVNNTFVSILP